MVQAVSGGSREDRGLGAEWTSNVQDVITHYSFQYSPLSRSCGKILFKKDYN